MAKKKITFADKANQIESKYYKTRKPGEDQMTDDAFNREMEALMMQQEAVKPKEAPQESANSQFANQEFANGGKLDDGKMGMIKARIAYADAFNNPAGKRMVSQNNKPGMTPEGAGSHYMSSVDNYAVPQLQDFGGDSLKYFDNPINALHEGKEAIRFENNEDAEYFAKNYKDVAPMSRNNKYANGGRLPKYYNGGGFGNASLRTDRTNIAVDNMSDIASYNQRNALFDPVRYNRNQSLDYNTDNFGHDAFKTEGFNLDSANEIVDIDNASNPSKPYSPTANILGPLLTTGANLVGSSILKNNAEKRKKELLGQSGINLGRVQSQQVDLGRDRANIKANAAQTEASARYLGRNARSASEAIGLGTAGRLASQRTAGDQLSKSLSTEELQNASLRSRADQTNVEIGNKEAVINQQRKDRVEQQYGDVPAQINADLVRTTGASFQNYMNENARLRSDDNYLQALAPNLKADYQEDFENLSPFEQRLRRLGIGNVNRNIKVRS